MTIEQAVRRFRTSYDHCEARIFAQYLRLRRRRLSPAHRIAFSRAYNRTK